MNQGIEPKHCQVGGFENILVKPTGKGKNEWKVFYNNISLF